ncbi:hypothetical protein RJT34_25342 [Clitoria ternatea]|uniref:Late embryogenesis abundant protein n=1 Tax=Clitoria ternatea TaxID=43366 RepID=A0AAN9FPU2_CLITE
MVRGSITKANLMFLGSCMGAKRAKSGFSKFADTSQLGATESCGRVSKSSEKKEDLDCWVPHPRTGIYFPKGHDWVMDDVPEDAARLSQTHWFRNIDGVDNPKYQS